MKRYEVLLAKELFPGSDEVRSFGYRAGTSGDYYALFRKRTVLCAAHFGMG